MSKEELAELLKTEKDPEKIEYLKWLLYGDGYYSRAEDNGAYY